MSPRGIYSFSPAMLIFNNIRHGIALKFHFIAYHTFHTIHKHNISDHRMILFKNIVLILSTKLFKMLLQQHLFGLTPTLFLSFNTDIIIFCVLVEISTYTCRHYNFQNYLNCLKKKYSFFSQINQDKCFKFVIKMFTKLKPIKTITSGFYREF